MSSHAPGDVVHGYRIVRTLGRGGLGTTFEATSEATGTAVALKRLAISDVDAWKRVELFEREARVLAGLSHPAIPRYLDHFTLDGASGPVLYIAQELVAGRTLAEVVGDGAPLGEAEVRRIAGELLEVLEFLGRQTPPVVHRDIKPENLLLRPDRSVALVDFGAARAAASPGDGGSTTVGTYGYMAPEQLQGVASPATDVYGLGCTLLFLLTGKAPTDLPRRRLAIDFRASARVSPPFAAWLDRALAPAPEDRFPSATEARASLQGATATALPRLTPFARKAVAGAAITAVVAGAGLGLRRHFLAPLDCPELADVDPSLRRLDLEELEARYRASAIFQPSIVEQQLRGIVGYAGEMYSPERRSCMARLSLISSIVNQEQTRRSEPEFWGLAHPVEELRAIYLSVPLVNPYTKEEREDVLDQLEKNFLPSGEAKSDGDTDFWRRHYIGMVIVTDATDETLAKLHTSRPRAANLLHLWPRHTAAPPPVTAPPDESVPSLGIPECDAIVTRWATCDPPKLGWTFDSLKKRYAWTDDASKASVRSLCKGQLEQFPEEACHYRK